MEDEWELFEEASPTPSRAPVAIAITLLTLVLLAGVFVFMRIAGWPPTTAAPAVSDEETTTPEVSLVDPIGRLTVVTEGVLRDVERSATSTVEAIDSDGTHYRVAISCQMGEEVESPEEFLQTLTIGILAGMYDYPEGLEIPERLTVQWYRSPREYRSRAQPVMDVSVRDDESREFLWLRIPPEALPDLADRYSVSSALEK